MFDIDVLVDSPVIAAIKDGQGLEECLKTDCQVIFVLYGNVCNIGEIVKTIKDGHKMAIVHMDLITGLSSKEVSVDFIKQSTHADGIISTKPMMVKRAKELGLLAIQRFFMIDSIALQNAKRQIEIYHPDCVEIMPGVMPKILKEIRDFVNVPVIAGGLITDKKDVMSALSSGADAISTTNRALWSI
ncbi:MAG: glycerol-3-phosphate responsive antiterminator [Clostridia bacterium]|nr:glycerol-3-phosphate responsive antiterminator [Lachnospiraceae bacterium]NCC00392.1 glycerol-3-phosphate responsive antiterminator [Clostridia bacterium]NCD02591.1 glycerol-3-phosphate responsive antiterminator [Clostridia bacterium]